MKRLVLYLTAALIIGGYTNAQVFSGTTTAQFLKIEAGARAIAMGGAFVSVADDVSAIYWHPAYQN